MKTKRKMGDFPYFAAILVVAFLFLLLVVMGADKFILWLFIGGIGLFTIGGFAEDRNPFFLFASLLIIFICVIIITQIF